MTVLEMVAELRRIHGALAEAPFGPTEDVSDALGALGDDLGKVLAELEEIGVVKRIDLSTPEAEVEALRPLLDSLRDTLEDLLAKYMLDPKTAGFTEVELRLNSSRMWAGHAKFVIIPNIRRTRRARRAAEEELAKPEPEPLPNNVEDFPGGEF